jgi:hypothetical protein
MAFLKWLRWIQPAWAGSTPSAEAGASPPQGEPVVHSDAPWKPGDPDLLGRLEFSRRLAETLQRLPSDEGIVVGLYGPWGSGKSSVLGMVKERLTGDSASCVVEFNPWYFRGQDALLAAFLAQLASSLGSRLGSNEDEFKRVLDKYGTLLSAVPVSPLGVDIGKVMKGLAERLANDSLESLRLQLEKMLADSKTRVVVLMDDLDRLDKNDLHAALKLVKLVGGLAGVSYLISLDDEMVAKSVGDQYGGDATAGHSFLEKIVQIPIRLPRTDSGTQRHLALGEVDRALRTSGIDLHERYVSAFRLVFDPLYEAQDRTLRTGKRIGNALAFSLPLLKEEVHLGDLLLIECLRVLLPNVHTALPRNRSLLLDGGSKFGGMLDAAGKQEALRSWNELLGLASSDERAALAEYLAALFPRVQMFTANVAYSSELGDSLASDRRVGSHDYFERYFLYAVPFDDVSHVRTLAITNALERGNPQEALAEARAVLNPRNADSLVRKVRYQQRNLSPIGNSALVEFAIGLAPELPDPENVSSFDTPFGQAMIAASQALRAAPSGSRGELAARGVSAPVPLVVSASFYQKIRRIPTENSTEQRRPALLTPEDEKAVGTLLGARLAEAARGEPFYMPNWNRAGGLLLFLWLHTRGRKEISDTLGLRFAIKPREALYFLLSQARRPFNAITGERLPVEFTRENYDSCNQFIDNATTATVLHIALAGTPPPIDPKDADEDAIPASNPSDELTRLGFRFLKIHSESIVQVPKQESTGGGSTVF